MSETRYPLTITKAQLRAALRVTNRKTFSEKYCTPEVVKKYIGMEVEEFKRVHVLDVSATKKAIEYFSLRPEDFEVRPIKRAPAKGGS